MAVETTVTCDLESCGVQRGEANHWFKVWITLDGRFGSSAKAFPPNARDIKDVCGAEHAQVMYARFLSSGTFAQ